MDGCDFLVWDDELEEVEAANPKSWFTTACKNCERIKEFGREFGREIGQGIGKKFSLFVIGVMCFCSFLSSRSPCRLIITLTRTVISDGQC
jgi:hypothetical protein